MAEIKVRQVDDRVVAALKARAKKRGVSLEEEVRATLSAFGGRLALRLLLGAPPPSGQLPEGSPAIRSWTVPASSARSGMRGDELEPSTAVLDASVAVRWVIPERGSEPAAELLSRPIAWIAPRLMVTEVAAAMRRKVVDGELRAETARQALEAIVTAVDGGTIRLADDEDVVGTALALALALGHTVPDCLSRWPSTKGRGWSPPAADVTRWRAERGVPGRADPPRRRRRGPGPRPGHTGHTSCQDDGPSGRRSSRTRPSRASFFRCEWTDCRRPCLWSLPVDVGVDAGSTMAGMVRWPSPPAPRGSGARASRRCSMYSSIAAPGVLDDGAVRGIDAAHVRGPGGAGARPCSRRGRRRPSGITVVEPPRIDVAREERLLLDAGSSRGGRRRGPGVWIGDEGHAVAGSTAVPSRRSSTPSGRSVSRWIIFATGRPGKRSRR